MQTKAGVCQEIVRIPKYVSLNEEIVVDAAFVRKQSAVVDTSYEITRLCLCLL